LTVVVVETGKGAVYLVPLFVGSFPSVV